MESRQLWLGGVDQGNSSEEEDEFEFILFAELQELWRVVLPIAAANVAEYVPTVLMLALVGHLPQSAAQLDAVALGIAFLNLFAFSFAFGAISGLKTLLPRAVSLKNPELLALFVQRALLLSFLVLCICFIPQYFAREILLGMGQQEEIAEMTAEYVIRAFPMSLNLMVFTVLQRALVAQGLGTGPLIVSSVGAITSFFVIWIFVHVLRLDYIGAAWASVVYSSSYPISILIFIVVKKQLFLLKPQSWNEIFKLSELTEFARLSLPGMMQLCLVWGATEIISVLSGLLPNPQRNIGASYIIMSLQNTLAMVWLALLVFSALRVGFFIGCQRADSAKRAAWFGCLCAFFLGCLFSAILFFARTHIVQILTNDAATRELAVGLIEILAIITPLDAVDMALNGILSGLGLHRTAALIPLIGSYVVSMPIACILAFGYNLSGGLFWLWGGVALGLFVSCVSQALILLFYDWDKAVQEAIESLSPGAVSINFDKKRSFLVSPKERSGSFT